jgi:hypothetical protein
VVSQTIAKPKKENGKIASTRQVTFQIPAFQLRGQNEDRLAASGIFRLEPGIPCHGWWWLLTTAKRGRGGRGQSSHGNISLELEDKLFSIG